MSDGSSFDEELKRIGELVAARSTELDARWAEFEEAVEEVARLARLAGKHVTSDLCVLEEGGPHDPDIDGQLSVGRQAVGLWIPHPFENDPYGIYGKWADLSEVPTDYRFILLRERVHHSLARNLRTALEEDGEVIARPISRIVLARPEPKVAEAAELLGWFKVAETWRRATARAVSRPDEATSQARSLIETVVKHIMEHHDEEIPSELKGAVRKALGLLGAQSDVNDQVRGGLQAIEGAVFSARNSKGDAHGSAPSDVPPTPAEAQLYVSLAGAVAAYLMTLQLEQEQADQDS